MSISLGYACATRRTGWGRGFYGFRAKILFFFLRSVIISGAVLFICRIWPHGVWFCSSSSSMSQVRVTNFFGQKKKGIQGKQPSGGVSGSSASEDYAFCSSAVHEEFVRVINEAAGLINDGESVSTKPSKDPSSPRTPKRSSADAGLDLGAAVFLAKKRRKAGGIREAEAKTSRTAKKKLVLHDETPQGKQPSSGVSGSSASEDYALSSSAVHEEFVRVINEAAGLINDGESVSTKPSKDPSSPRTPKRSSADAGLDLGAAVFLAKKRRKAGGIREAEAKTSEKTSRTAKKKLVLHDETPQVSRTQLCSESTISSIICAVYV
ncbi:hypothetical protein XENOCAPTIV_020291 [Xenoophorus captivus]|uniref:Uncharacterized protein n=1 Tax=Xenoophorus captivus TaxID=1517983 RepID=A0ABV0SIP5_9TELE